MALNDKLVKAFRPTDKDQWFTDEKVYGSLLSPMVAFTGASSTDLTVSKKPFLGLQMPQLLSTRIRACQNLTKAEKSLANFLLTKPNLLMLDTAASLAAKSGVSTMTVSRFIRKIGYVDYAEAQQSAKHLAFGPSTAEANSLLDRYQQHETGTTNNNLTNNLALELEAINQVYTLRNSHKWTTWIANLAAAEAVYVASFELVRHTAMSFVSQLEFVRPQVRYLDALSGSYNALFTHPQGNKVLLIFDTYPYNTQAKELAKKAAAENISLFVVCDEFCHWARDLTSNVLSVSTNTGLVFRSKGAMNILNNLLIEDVITKLGDEAKTHMQKITELSAQFAGYERQ